MIKCPKCQSSEVAKTYVESVYKTIGVNDQEVYEIVEIGSNYPMIIPNFIVQSAFMSGMKRRNFKNVEHGNIGIFS